MPKRIISDNVLNLNNNLIAEVCSQFKIRHHNLSPYRPKMNCVVEVANKNIKKIVGKMTETYKDWHEKLPFALLAYRTSVRTSTGATPFSLVYGMEAVLPIEVEIPSLRVLAELKLDEAEWIQSRYDQLNLVEEKRLKAIRHGKGGIPVYFRGRRRSPYSSSSKLSKRGRSRVTPATGHGGGDGGLGSKAEAGRENQRVSPFF
ncbi:uncharacterized protein LOC105772091 [Gossypium raimondii]|uniref:uncharacterized protein LOC105772091 n=1 Tax=Gossypium raimondii TaxID=29730 RepID=UPI00227D5102|nr:uncharacterized protein LOC105772091 [Gossypium raimondii]